MSPDFNHHSKRINIQFNSDSQGAIYCSACTQSIMALKNPHQNQYMHNLEHIFLD